MRLFAYFHRSMPDGFLDSSFLNRKYVVLSDGQDFFLLTEEGEIKKCRSLSLGMVDEFIKKGEWEKYRVYSKYVTNDMRPTHVLWSQYQLHPLFDFPYSHFAWTTPKVGRLFMLRELEGEPNFLSPHLIRNRCTRYLCVGKMVGVARTASIDSFNSFWKCKRQHKKLPWLNTRRTVKGTMTSSSLFLLGKASKILDEIKEI